MTLLRFTTLVQRTRLQLNLRGFATSSSSTTAGGASTTAGASSATTGTPSEDKTFPVGKMTPVRGVVVVPTFLDPQLWVPKFTETHPDPTYRTLAAVARRSCVSLLSGVSFSGPGGIPTSNTGKYVNRGHIKVFSKNCAPVSVPCEVHPPARDPLDPATVPLTADRGSNRAALLADQVERSEKVDISQDDLATIINYIESLGTCNSTTGDKDKKGRNGKSTVLVCVHGSRDCRCGERGVPLVNALRAQYPEDQVDIVGVTHVGGHAYAPNVAIFPHGHFLGLCGCPDTASAAEVVSKALETDSLSADAKVNSSLRQHYRGSFL